MLDILQTHGKGAAFSQYLDMGSIVKESRPKTNIAGVLKKMAVPAMLVAGMALLALSFISLKNYQADYGRLEAELAQANTQLEQKQSASDDSQQAEAQISELSARADEINFGKQAIFTPREYVAEAASVIACLPPNVTVNTLEVDVVEIALSGTAAQPGPVILFADNLETAGGFSEAIITWIDRPHDMGETQQLYFRISVTRG
jgi:cell division protein FtsB